jgi:hypothetical protein
MSCYFQVPKIEEDTFHVNIAKPHGFEKIYVDKMGCCFNNGNFIGHYDVIKNTEKILTDNQIRNINP